MGLTWGFQDRIILWSLVVFLGFNTTLSLGIESGIILTNDQRATLLNWWPDLTRPLIELGSDSWFRFVANIIYLTSTHCLLVITASDVEFHISFVKYYIPPVWGFTQRSIKSFFYSNTQAEGKTSLKIHYHPVNITEFNLYYIFHKNNKNWKKLHKMYTYIYEIIKV